jgi:Asp-tRNA(Asn)/Glu-tRNA(Gln) amidotransferase A subunit family amidase
MNDELCFIPAVTLAKMLSRKEVSAVEVVDAVLDRIGRRNPTVNAFTIVLEEEARARAEAADRTLGRGGSTGPLHGLPVAIKDLYEEKAGLRTTMGGPSSVHYVPRSSSTFVRRLEEAGAIVVGKTNVPEFGADPSAAVADNRTFGATISPLAPGFSSGGSSGGSAAAVVDGLAALAQGSDGGGSLRIPASLCGAYSIKATYGRVAHAARPDAFSVTPHIVYGPITRTVADAALMLEAMIGFDPRDPLSTPDDGFVPTQSLSGGIEGMRVAYCVDFGGIPVDPQVAAVVDDAVQGLAEAGAHVETIRMKLPADQRVLSDLWVSQVAVLNAGLVEQKRKDGFELLGDPEDPLGAEFRRWVQRGEAMSALDALRGSRLRTAVFDMVEDVFEGYELLVTATLGTAGFPIGSAPGTTQAPREINGVAVEPGIGWCLTYPINFTGHPAASIPAGLVGQCPVGMQIIGRRFDDASVLRSSAAFESTRPWHRSYERLLRGDVASSDRISA